MQGHHAGDCGNYPIKCELCHSDVPRHNVSVDVLAETANFDTFALIQQIDEHRLKQCEKIQCTCGELVSKINFKNLFCVSLNLNISV